MHLCSHSQLLVGMLYIYIYTVASEGEQHKHMQSNSAQYRSATATIYIYIYKQKHHSGTSMRQAAWSAHQDSWGTVTWVEDASWWLSHVTPVGFFLPLVHHLRHAGWPSGLPWGTKAFERSFWCLLPQESFLGYITPPPKKKISVFFPPPQNPCSNPP